MKKIKNILLLGSTSQSRQRLLEEAKIPFALVAQHADESCCDWGLPLPQLVESIARHKMDHVVLPEGKEGEHCFVLTADTLSQDKDGIIQGKPIDRADAIEKIKKARNGSRLYTSFCLDKKIYVNGSWQIERHIQKTIGAEYLFLVPDEWIDYYLEHSYGLVASNAIAVEGFGGQFLKMAQGSYTAIVGLPMFELREALNELDFFG